MFMREFTKTALKRRFENSFDEFSQQVEVQDETLSVKFFILFRDIERKNIAALTSQNAATLIP